MGQTKRAVFYITAHGKAPCEEWINDLKDKQARAAIRVRIRRLEEGNPGNHRI